MKTWLALVLWLGAFAAPAAAQPQTTPAPREPFPMSVFARLPELQQPRLSTDGKALAMRLRVNGEQVQLSRPGVMYRLMEQTSYRKIRAWCPTKSTFNLQAVRNHRTTCRF